MMKKHLLAAFVAGLALTAAASAADAQGGHSDRVRFRCKAHGADVEMQARYESRGVADGARREFRAEIEGGASSGLVDGQELWISVDGANVGSIAITEFAGGAFSGETRFSSRVKGERLAFPPNFPSLATGSTVSLLTGGGATVLGCTFE